MALGRRLEGLYRGHLRAAQAADRLRGMSRHASTFSSCGPQGRFAGRFGPLASRLGRGLCLGLTLTAASVALAACDKGGGTEAPGGEGKGGAKKADGIEFAYATDGFTVTTNASVIFEIAGAQSGFLEMAGSGELVAAPEGGKLKVTSTIGDLTKVEIDGVLAKQIKADPEKLKAAAKGQKNWMIMGLDGEIDTEATEAIPEVAARTEKAKAKAEEKEKAAAEKEAAEGEGEEGAEGEEGEEMDEADLGEFGSQLLSLPSLPKVALKVGKETKLPTEEEEFPLGGDTMPVEVDRTYTLESIDDSSGERIATVKFLEEGSGAKEMQGPQGAAFISVEQESTGTLVFNLDKGVPVKFDTEQASALSFGDQTFEQIVEIHYDFTSAG